MEAATLNPLDRLTQHRNTLERRQLQSQKESAAGVAGARHKGFPFSKLGGTFSQRNNANSSAAGADKDTTDWGALEKLETGKIVNIRYDERRGMVRCDPGGNEVVFYLEQCKYGMRKIKEDDPVKFRLDTFKPRYVAVDVQPSNIFRGITEEDVRFFIEEGTRTAPIYIMRNILLSREEWPVFLASVPTHLLLDVVLTTVRMTTASDQLNNPIHTRVIRSFLQLLAWSGESASAVAVSTSSGANAAATPSAVAPPATKKLQPFFPNFIVNLVSTPPSTITIEDLERRVNLWIDIAELVLLFRRLTIDIKVDMVADPLIAAATFCLTTLRESSGLVLPNTTIKALNQVVRRSSAHEAAFMRTAIIPSVEEMSLPTWHSQSALHAKTLPVITDETFSTSDDYVVAHCKLLRADNFSKTVNVLGHLCFDIAEFHVGETPNEKQRLKDVVQDSQHHNFFQNVKFLGRVLSRANDYAVSRSYIFGLDEGVRRTFVPPAANTNAVTSAADAPPADVSADTPPVAGPPAAAKTTEKNRPLRWMSALREGTLVCFTTGPNRSVIESNEIFWGVVSSSDLGVRAHHMVSVHPVQGDFELLISNLERNKANGATSKNQMLETAVFFTGYKSVMEGLLTYIGPHSATVPFKEILLAGNKEDIISAEDINTVEELLPDEKPKAVIKNPNRVKSKDKWHIPPFAVPAFRQLVHNSRAAFTFDVGQDQSMRKLDRRPIMLVQGPPGTGKSFMGCRIVETYVRYKQMISSGEILNALDVEKLSDPLLSTIAPSLEAGRPNYLGPIVVITYKNHALDEFLLDMKRSKLWENERARPAVNSAITYPRGCRIVRVGGRSMEAELDSFNLNTLMMGSNVAKYRVAPYRERIGILSSRMERLAKEIAYLEKGNVPGTYFRNWLTEEQRKTISFEQKDAWLRGENYSSASHGVLSSGLVPPNHYLSYLQSDLRERLERGAVVPNESGAGNNDDEKGGTNTVFGNMEKEIRDAERGDMDEGNISGEFTVSDRFASVCISAESVRFATQAPKLPASISNPQQIMTLWSLAPIARHQFYAYLIQKCIGEKCREYLLLQEQVETAVCLRAHAQDESRLELLQQSDVIGLTTTGCAMNQALLRALRPRVLVVEEAAEVLESQLIACMSESLSQLVLIGDHYQLKPSVENYELEIHNKFNTSLFERLTKLIDPILLVEQRRMRPGISCLVRQFYDRQGLQDHASVLSRPFIDAQGHKHYEGALGLQRDAFLWTHTHPEETAVMGLSKVNLLEIKLCHMLVTHLTEQGVAPSSITVITPYLGQKKALSATFANSDSSAVRHVHVSTVDLFQGDENDIIIVSLVRTEKLTAFMMFRNRMIVACSRARHAMVLIGSDELLARSEHWNEVLINLRGDNCVGDMLPITQNGEKRLLCQDGTTLKQ